MMTSSRLRDTGESFASRRGHSSQLSISDPSHHVTEAIGTLYGDSDDDSPHESRRDARPLSFIASPYGGEQILKPPPPRLRSPMSTSDQLPSQNHLDDSSWSQVGSSAPPLTVTLTAPNSDPNSKTVQIPTLPANQKTGTSFDGTLPPAQQLSPLSPTLSLREDVQNSSQFPITNIDNPDDIAQELSNLQALRRLSIGVGNTVDPDLMPFQGLSLMAMPSIAPTGEDDEGDISRLLWVPAKVHPELAPDQFKSFLENRVQSMKRRSGESLLSVDGAQSDAGGLRRKKSMLSRQVGSETTRVGPGSISHAEDDFASQNLKRNSSLSASFNAPELSLNELVKDPSKVVQKLTMDTQRQVETGLETSSIDDDKPILAVPTMGLRRSTRTTYRKGGSLRSGNRQPLLKRAATRQSDRDIEQDVDEPLQSSPSSETSGPGFSLHCVESEPVQTDAFARPELSVARRQPPSVQQMAIMDASAAETTALELLTDVPHSTAADPPDTDASSGYVPTASVSDISAQVLDRSVTGESAQVQAERQFPQRSSSQTTPSSSQLHAQEQPLQQPPPRSSKRPPAGRANTQQPLLATTATHKSPEPLPNSSAISPSRKAEAGSQAVSPIQGVTSTLNDNPSHAYSSSVEERKADKKAKEKDDNESSKSMSWKWFKSEDKDKKKKDKDKEEHATKTRTKSLGERSLTEKPYDNTRLDVIQNQIDSTNPKGRDSVVLDRESVDIKVRSEEKKKEGSRKTSDAKKEKDGFFGSIFGGSRRKENKDGGGSKTKQRPPSPEPVAVILRPDVDYPYTRFPIVEERAIYRMAHIKLANPRRDLRSQVLLSNFMYSYLAKVQAMHPQLNVPTSPQQKRQEEERKRREREQQQQQQHDYQNQQQEQRQQTLQKETQNTVDHHNLEYHRADNEYENTGRVQADLDRGDCGNYVSDYQNGKNAQSDCHGQDLSVSTESSSRQGVEDYNSADQAGGQRGYYEYGNSDDQRENDMW